MQRNIFVSQRFEVSMVFAAPETKRELGALVRDVLAPLRGCRLLQILGMYPSAKAVLEIPSIDIAKRYSDQELKYYVGYGIFDLMPTPLSYVRMNGIRGLSLNGLHAGVNQFLVPKYSR